MANLHPNSTNYVHTYEPNTNDLTMSMGYDSAGRPMVRTGNFNLDVSRGAVPGHTNAFLGGRNRSVPNNTEETIWNVGGLYPWQAWSNGAVFLTIVSASTADTGIVLLLDGLDADYNMQTEVIVTNGTTAVTTTKRFIRLNSATNIGSKACVGNIDIKHDAHIVGRIEPIKQSTSMAIYTVPAGHTAFSTWGDFGILGSASAELRAYWRFYGGVFLGIYATPVTSQSYQTAPPLPGRIPEKTDIDNRVAQGTNNLQASSNQQLLLIQNSYL